MPRRCTNRRTMLSHPKRSPSAMCRDARGRVYPARSRRLAPDFFFHDQIYRQNGEEILLPAGQYHVSYTRGPEYQVLERDIDVPAGKQHTESFRMKRWINLAATGWY